MLKALNAKLSLLIVFFQDDKYILDVQQLNLDQSSDINFSKDLNIFMESKIKEHPEEYLWQHRRFKSTLGKENFYA